MVMKEEPLAPEIYRCLEDVVGPENISAEPAIRDGYCFVWGNLMICDDEFGRRPVAVVLPGSTREVQGVVRVCNRYKLPFRAHSTGFSCNALYSDQPMLSVDLRRMNRILDIDEKNMIAVIEPYVTVAELMVEANRKGVRCHVIGAGCGVGVIPSCTSLGGTGTTNVSTGFAGRLALGLEWVLPNGEILKLGSLGAGAGWFNGDGPGPSLRGLMRGFGGANGGMGIFTKAGVKLTPWYGPAEVEITGESADYVAKVPDAIKVITASFAAREDVYEAIRELCEEGVAFALSRRGPFTMLAAMTKSNDEVYRLLKETDFLEKNAHALNLLIDASSPREMNYREKVSVAVIEKHHGTIVPETLEGETARFIHAWMGAGSVKGVFRASGASGVGAPTAHESLDLVKRVNELGYGIKVKYAQEGTCLDDADPTWVTPFEHGATGAHSEMAVRSDVTIPSVRESMRRLVAECEAAVVKENLALHLYEGAMRTEPGRETHDVAGPKCLNYHIWMRKLKKAFDPNLVADAFFYTRPKE